MGRGAVNRLGHGLFACRATLDNLRTLLRGLDLGLSRDSGWILASRMHTDTIRLSSSLHGALDLTRDGRRYSLADFAWTFIGGNCVGQEKSVKAGRRMAHEGALQRPPRPGRERHTGIATTTVCSHCSTGEVKVGSDWRPAHPKSSEELFRQFGGVPTTVCWRECGASSMSSWSVFLRPWNFSVDLL